MPGRRRGRNGQEDGSHGFERDRNTVDRDARSGGDGAARAPGTPDGYGGVNPGTWTDYPATAATTLFDEELAAIAGGLMEAGDLRLCVAAEGLAITPEVGDRVVAEGETYRVIRVTTHGTDGSAAYYELQVRRDPVA
ncbi:hypothetical protein ACFOHS_07905 [Jhaorihella thermophila]